MALKGDHLHGGGTFSQNAAKLISDKVGGGKVLLTPSCTHALEMASMLINLSPGDEVILPTYTFTSAATAITKFGATPVFVDIDEQTKGINVDQVVQAITSRTKAISWVNYAGTAPEIERIQKIAEENRIFLIEDNAHGLGGRYKGKVLGSFGDLATQSFHGTKNIQCGEGGALVINNINLFERAEIIREKGTDRSKYLRGDIQKYQWIDQGSSYLLAEPLAALLQGNLEEFNRIHSHRLEIWNHYYEPKLFFLYI
jgi:dTDP-4-amino-4,6-dideoxygalactose transaminase